MCDADPDHQVMTVLLSSTCHQCSIAPPSEPRTRTPPTHQRRRSRACFSTVALLLPSSSRASWIPWSNRSPRPPSDVRGLVGGFYSIQGFVVRPAIWNARIMEGRHAESMRRLELRKFPRLKRSRPEVSMALTAGLQPEIDEQSSR